MLYLEEVMLPSDMDEYWMIVMIKNIHNSYYPLHIFPEKGLSKIQFEPITIFAGENGCGKSTLLHILANKVHAKENNIFDYGDLFRQYVDKVEIERSHVIETECKFIASDDVFDELLDERAVNSGVNRRKDDLSKEYLESKFGKSVLYQNDDDTYKKLKNQVDARRMTQSKYIRSRLTNGNLTVHSNGETAISFWQSEIQEGGLYFIDEPENSLSCENQLKLKKYIEDSARFFDCQFVIATHSPFLLALDHARIYDFSSQPVKVSKWQNIKSVNLYFDFFDQRRELFKGKEDDSIES